MAQVTQNWSSPVLTLGQGIGAEESQIPCLTGRQAVPGNEISLIGAGIDFKQAGLVPSILVKLE